MLLPDFWGGPTQKDPWLCKLPQVDLKNNLESKMCPPKESPGFANFLRLIWKMIESWNYSSRPPREKGDLRRILVLPRHPIERWTIQWSTDCFVSMTPNIRVVSNHFCVWHHLDNALGWFTFHPDILTSWKIYPHCHLIWSHRDSTMMNEKVEYWQFSRKRFKYKIQKAK